VDTFMNLAKEAFGRTRRSYDEAQIRAAVERLDKAWDEGLAGRPGQGQRSPIRRRTKRWSRRDERPALHWSVRAVTAQREALAGQNLFHAWMCLAGGIKDDKRGAFTYDIWASAHRSVSKEAPARTRKHTSESKVWVQRRRESS